MALTQERAEQRTKCIKENSISYHFHVSLSKGQQYSGYAEITFSLEHIPSELVLDFKGKEVTGVNQNGEQAQIQHKDGFIYLELTKLKVGFNGIGVHYTCKYDNDGSGCVSFVDVDSKQYISTQFAPYYANRVFPCFDQPDLKGKMVLSIISPSEWKKVLSNEYAIVQKQFESQEYVISSQKPYFIDEVNTYLKDKTGNMTIFPETKILSTYLFCFVAGQYVQLKLEEDKQYRVSN